jgi:hypothetical protein
MHRLCKGGPAVRAGSLQFATASMTMWVTLISGLRLLQHRKDVRCRLDALVHAVRELGRPHQGQRILLVHAHLLFGSVWPQVLHWRCGTLQQAYTHV